MEILIPHSIDDIKLYAVIFITSIILSIILTPIVKKIAIKHGFVDLPDERKMHKEPVAYGGGIAIFISFFLTVIGGSAYLYFSGMQISSRDIRIAAAFLIGTFFSALLGFIDDKIAMKAKHKLIAQILIILILVPFGVSVTFLSNPFADGMFYFPTWVAVLITIFWIAGIMNAINLLDGLDGLLGGVAAISGIIFAIVAFIKGHYVIVAIMVAMAGSCIGFLKYNFNPAKIFMGDTGSLCIGMSFGIASVLGGLKTTTTLSLLIPFLIMGLPILDTSWAIIRRATNGQPIFKPDKGHIHHRLLGLGLSVRQAVIIIYAINLILGIAAIAICYSCHTGINS